MIWGFCVYFVYMIPLETDVLRKHRFQKLVTLPAMKEAIPAASVYSFMRRIMRFQTMRHMHPAKAHISMRICVVWKEILLVA